MLGLLGSGYIAEGHLVPANDRNSATFGPSLDIVDGHMAPKRRKPGRRALLDGNFARRKQPLREAECCIWDTELAGFGLRVRPTGNTYWFVRLRHRGKHRRITLGRSDELAAGLARAQARRLLAEVALDGLPKRAGVKAAPVLSDFVDTYWDDLSRVWKASTTKRNWNAWKTVIAPTFGAVRVTDLLPADIHRWRDDCSGPQEALFNRALPVLAASLKYAEALRLRRKGSNPCWGMPRNKREPKERSLTPAEYRRIGAALREQEAADPAQVAIVRLLLFTGARIGEILNLRWEWAQPPRLLLPDNKTGAKTIWLDSQALEVLEGIERHENTPLAFPNRARTKPLNFENGWLPFRARYALPDVRVHDLRHSFASTAIMDNVPLATIGRLLGHVLPEATAKYAHLSDDVIGDAADRIAGSLAQAIGLRP
ncbi:site-specific integrase [Novosphingobium sp. ERW19]|uniref:tyrosine-type recombinase/integrase n=1 Tax=Novosphingobium sp. ERW19 TaxID=2726186 RepID=UPI001F0E60B2|nr:site-specific integrase [Novosphingobium sp. ERW19]